ncbi:MAG TPA: M48 family metallopeptidase [Stellaceae bacterium]|nr:M48 family metallopeptidase [Stellaceae bacterium]
MAQALGLSTYRWNNNLKSILLLAAFPFLLLLLIGSLVFICAWGFLTDYDGVVRTRMLSPYGYSPEGAGYGPFAFTLDTIYAYWPFIVGAAVVWLLVAYAFNDVLIHAATGAQQVTRASAPRLYKIIEPLCISRGLAVPQLYVIDTDAMNAYASGIDRRTYSITVTRALLDRLDDRELEAVLAHELTHILDRDVRLLLVTVVFVGAISFIAQLLWRSLRVMSFRRSRGNAGLVLLAAAVVAGIGYLLALILRFAISRRREYLADAGSVELTKSPEALISALKKISENADVPHVPSEVRQMFIENPLSESGFFNLFATHPPIADRIRVLERLEGVPLPERPHSSGPWGAPPPDSAR